MGMPPRTGLEPSSAALELRNRFSLPLLDFHEMMVAPCRRTSMRSPCGSEATTRELSSEMVTSGAGAEGEMGISEGFFERSTILNRCLGLSVVEEDGFGVSRGSN